MLSAEKLNSLLDVAPTSRIYLELHLTNQPDKTYALRLSGMIRSEETIQTEYTTRREIEAAAMVGWSKRPGPLLFLHTRVALEGWWDTIARHASNLSSLVIVDEHEDTVWQGRVLTLAHVPQYYPFLAEVQPAYRSGERYLVSYDSDSQLFRGIVANALVMHNGIGIDSPVV